MKSWREYDADFESRIARYRETARRLRSVAETIVPIAAVSFSRSQQNWKGSPTASQDFGLR